MKNEIIDMQKNLFSAYQNAKTIINNFGSFSLDWSNIEKANEQAKSLSGKFQIVFREEKKVLVRIFNESQSFEQPASINEINDILKRLEKAFKGMKVDKKSKELFSNEEIKAWQKDKIDTLKTLNHGFGFSAINANFKLRAISQTSETELKQIAIEAMTKELEEKKAAANYLYGKKRGAWGIKTKADEKRANEIDNLSAKLDSLKTKQPEAPKPARKKQIFVKVCKTTPALATDAVLNDILTKLQKGEYLLQKEITYLQKHGTPPAGFKYNRFAKLEKIKL